MKHLLLKTLAILLLLPVACVHEPFTVEEAPQPEPTGTPCDSEQIYFNRDVLTILHNNCYTGCHDPENGPENKGVILEDYNSIMNTADVRPGDAEGSDLYEMITEEDEEDRMPPDGLPALSAEEIALIRLWINSGAPNSQCDFDEGNDTANCNPTNISFSNDVRPLLNGSPYNCQSCHVASHSSGIVLTDYSGVKSAVESGRLMGAIRHESGYTAMPQGGSMMKLCDIKMIQIWIDEGMQDN